MKVYLKAYLNKNLGDDLFVKTLCERFERHQFYLYNQKIYPIASNLTIKNDNIVLRGINKILRKISSGKLDTEIIKSAGKDLTVVIGGSMYIQNKNSLKYKYAYITKKPYYIMGVNFGPYTDQEFYRKYEYFFKKAQAVSFRDEYSYQLFHKLKNVQLYPDIAFSCREKYLSEDGDKNDIPNHEKKTDEKKTAVISVVDIAKRTGTEYAKAYSGLLKQIIHELEQRGYRIILMSFCKEEGDEAYIEKLQEEWKSKKETYYYDGDIDEAMQVLKDSSLIVGSRFHANILGLMLDKKIIPIAYSAKTTDTLKYIHYDGYIIDARHIDASEAFVKKAIDENLNYEYDASLVSKEAEKHFQALGNVLER